MKFRLPEMWDEAVLRDYMREHYDHGEFNVSESFGLSSCGYAKWLTEMRNHALIGEEQWGRSLLYLCFDNDKLIGLLHIRYELSEELSGVYGNIGYGVRPTERRKGYATTMLQYGLIVCRKKGLCRAIIGCYKDNIASATVIQNCGGILFTEDDRFTPGRISQYYFITITEKSL